MIKVLVNNSISKVQDLSSNLFKSLRLILSYEVPKHETYYSGQWGNTRRFMMDRYGNFPTGLLGLVIDHLEASEAEYSIIDSRVVPRPLETPLVPTLAMTPYPHQVEAARALKDRGIITAPTGVGKSVIMALVVQNLNVKTLIVVPNLELKRQLTRSFKEWFGADRVGSKSQDKDITIENIDALDPKVKPNGVGMVIIDEFHHAAAKSYRNLNEKAWTDVYYRVGVTATAFRSQEHETMLLEGVLSERVYDITYKEAVYEGYIVPVEAYYIEIPKQPVPDNCNSWAQVYSKLVVNNVIRNDNITRLLLKTHAKKLSTLCLVKEIKHGEFLSHDGAFHFVKGENDDNSHVLDAFSKGEISTLVATTGVVGEGVDTKAAEYVIIAGLGKSKNAFMQQVGRSVRCWKGKESAKIIIFRDPSHKFTLNHFRTQCKILKDEYGVTPQLLELTED